MANKRQKPRSMLRNQRPGRMRTPPIDISRLEDKPPRAPSGLRKSAQAAWRSFWSSDMAAAVDRDTDMPALERWAFCLSERERFSELIAKSPLVKGSMGQWVTNPLASQVAQLDKQIKHYEEHFGMTPLARMRLGIEAVDDHMERKFQRVQSRGADSEGEDPRSVLKVVS